MRNLKRYICAVVDAGGVLGNIADVVEHYHLGTSPRRLAKLSKIGLVR